MKIQCKNYNIVINDWNAFRIHLQKINFSSCFVLVDENTEKYCLHILLEQLDIKVHVLRINAGEEYKTVESCQKVWNQLLAKGADRHSLVLNLGGGVIGDLGGFCAATYMRGIRFIQLPTTLLSQVDASVGGKLGVDFNGYKNMIGIIQDPDSVFIFTEFLKTLPFEQFRSGYAELLKHGLIADKIAWDNLSAQQDILKLNYEELVYESVMIKKTVTEEDPTEQGKRKILNFGHTVGHAVESYWLEKNAPLLHGDAIAIGMISESFLSYRLGNITEPELFEIRNSILRLYGHHPKAVNPKGEIIRLMQKDKKNRNGQVKFALLEEVGHAFYDINVENEVIEESLIFYEEKL